MGVMEDVLKKSPDRELDQGIKAWDVKTSRGNLAALEELRIGSADPKDTTFVMAQGGELLSLLDGDPISATFEIANGQTKTIELNQPGHCVFLPGGLSVTFRSNGLTYCLNELVGVNPANRYDLKVLEHRSEVAKYLMQGTHVSGDAELGPIIEANPDSAGCFIYPISHFVHPDGSCVVLVIPNTFEEAVYRGTAPISVELLEGKGTLYKADLETLQVSIETLEKGKVSTIEPGSIYRYQSTDSAALVLRDTAPGFKPEHEVTLNEYLKGSQPPKIRGTVHALESQGWRFALNPMQNLRSMGR